MFGSRESIYYFLRESIYYLYYILLEQPISTVSKCPLDLNIYIWLDILIKTLALFAPLVFSLMHLISRPI